MADGDAAVCGHCKTRLPIPGASAAGKILPATDATFAEVVGSARVPVLLGLWAPWCGPCRMLTSTLEKLGAAYGARAQVVKLNVDETPVTAVWLDARSIPLFVIPKRGHKVDRLVGLQPADAIQRPFDRFVATP